MKHYFCALLGTVQRKYKTCSICKYKKKHKWPTFLLWSGNFNKINHRGIATIIFLCSKNVAAFILIAEVCLHRQSSYNY